MTIFMISETLTAGGAEWFSLRLADTLREQGNKVYFFVLRPDLINEGLRTKFPELNIITLPIPHIKRLVFLDRIVKKITGKYLLVQLANVKLLKKYIALHTPDVVHGHLIEADIVAIKANNAPQAHNVTTNHGDYISALKENKRKEEIAELMQKLSGMAVISDEQLNILNSYYPQATPKITKIYNGYPLSQTKYSEPDESVFCFGMIARAIPEKGWKPLMEAFSRLTHPNIKLLLYGKGDYLESLKENNKDQRIVFAGFTNDPLNAISNMHVGLLPSYLKAESLPTTIIEYLALGKPVIATDVGEVRNMMLTDKGDSAGILIEETDKDKMVTPLYEAMKKILEDKAFYQSKKSFAKQAFEKFEMSKCIEAYLKLYKSTS